MIQNIIEHARRELFHKPLVPILLAFWGVHAALKLTACDICPSLSVLGYPLSLWGVGLYSAAAILFALGAYRPLRILLLAAFPLHLFLLGWGISRGIICPTCLKLAGLTGILLLFSHVISEQQILKLQVVSRTIFALLVVASVIYLARPVTIPEQSPAANTAVNKSEQTLTVYDREGNALNIDLENHPVLFFAWWCYHCDEALAKVSGLKEKPVLVSTYFKKNGRDYEETDKKLTAHGLSGERIYYLPENPPVGRVPTLVKSENGIIKELKL